MGLAGMGFTGGILIVVGVHFGMDLSRFGIEQVIMSKPGN